MSSDHATPHEAPLDVPVLIVGAGPTGLVLALWLTRLGVRVRIIDKTAEPGTTSRALAVQARTLEFYAQLGIADETVARGVKISTVNLWAKGKKRAQVVLENIGESVTPFPFPLVFPQDEHEQMLIEHLARLGVHVERRTELIRFEQRPTSVRALLRRPDGSEETCTAAYLAGCDGAHSTVRDALGIGFPGGTYAGLFYVADVTASGPVTDLQLHAALDEADLLLVFPMQGEGRLRLVGNVHQDPGDGELTFDDVSPRALEQLHLKIAQVHWLSTYRVHHRVANSFQAGRAYLLGDAAHIHSPVGGQGMNTGIGDAVNLAWKLAAVLKDGADARLLESFELERIGFARRLVATTDRVFTFVTAQGRLARFLRTRIFPRFVRLLFRSATARRFLFSTVSQTGIRYRNSPLSEGVAGPVHGGDRLPWVETGVHTDNYAPLASRSWQVHVYGDPPAELVSACSAWGLPLHAFPWKPSMQRAGLTRGALYLVRPDGYLALVERHANPDRLARYLTARAIEDSPPN